jgi:hypothetical protein
MIRVIREISYQNLQNNEKYNPCTLWIVTP